MRVFARCDQQLSDFSAEGPFRKCAGVRHFEGLTENLCGEPCRFTMGKDGTEPSEAVKALATAVRVAGEARDEWDRAPNGAKAGKLLIALSDPTLNYRADITAMHAALKAK